MDVRHKKLRLSFVECLNMRSQWSISWHDPHKSMYHSYTSCFKKNMWCPVSKLSLATSGLLQVALLSCPQLYWMTVWRLNKVYSSMHSSEHSWNWSSSFVLTGFGKVPACIISGKEVHNCIVAFNNWLKAFPEVSELTGNLLGLNDEKSPVTPYCQASDHTFRQRNVAQNCWHTVLHMNLR